MLAEIKDWATDGSTHRTDGSAPSEWSRWTVLAWTVVAAGLLLATVALVTDDFRTRPVVGDQASHLLQGLSLAREGHNLSFDTQDYAEWQAVGWGDVPAGLFSQAREDGWGFAKPYGYSVWLAPFLLVVDPPVAVALANAILFLAFFGLCAALVWLRYRGAVVPLAAGAMALCSYALYYGFVLHADLFLGVVTASFVYVVLVAGRRSGRSGFLWSLVAAIVGGFILTEKAPALALVGPTLLWLVLRLPGWRRRLVLVATSALGFAAFSLPYLYYSDWASLTPYGGERYYSGSVPPFVPGGAARRMTSDEIFSLSYAVEAVSTNLGGSLEAAGLYVFGRHTGMAVFMPAALAFISLAAVWTVVRWRRRREIDPGAAALLVGVVGYVAFYVVLFPNNYYGGGQSIGNRYFLQISAAALAAAVAAAVSARAIARASLVAGVVGLLTLSAHHADPRWAFIELDRTSAVQNLFPFEDDLDGSSFFRCGQAVCFDEPADTG